MSTGPVATATVKVIPDTTGFRALLQAQVAAATAGVTANVNATLGAAGAAAVAGSGGSVGAAGKKASSGLKAATAESNALRGSLIGLSRVTPVTVFGLGVYGTAALAAGTAIKYAIGSTAEFEHQLYVFQATTRATAMEMGLVTDAAKALGADLSLPSTSAGDAARAMTELAKGGLSVKDTLAAARGTLQLAAAAEMDVGDAAVFVVTQLNAFGLAGDQATHVADLLAGASTAAQGDIRDFGTAFQQVSAVARQVGLTIEETTGTMVQLARAGLRGADMGTSFRTMLLRLTPTTKQAQEYMDALGVVIDKNRPIGEQYAEIIDQLKRSTDALNDSARTQAITQIFGQDAFRAASIAIREGSPAWQQAIEDANRLGEAERLAAANGKGLKGALNGLKSNLDTLGITLGGLVSGPMEDFLVVMGKMAGGATAVAEAIAGIKVPSWMGGSTTSFVAGWARDLLLFYPAVRREFFPKQNPSIPESPEERKARLDTARNFVGQIGGKSLAGPLLVRPGESPYPQKPVYPPLSPAAAAAVQARIDALNKKARKPVAADTQATNRLQIAQLNAQLSGNLQAELAADKAIEAYFQKRLKLAVKGTNRYVLILGALQSANAASRSVQDQITADAKAAADQRKADAAEAKRVAEQAQAEAAQAAKDLLSLQMSTLDLAIQQADYTENKIDDVTKRQIKIKAIDRRIKQLNAIKKKTTEEKQAIVDLRKERLDLLSQIKGLKNDGSDSGFTLSDLFRETTQAFNQYASNISTAPMTAGGATKSLFAARHVQFLAGKLTPADRLKLEKMTETNRLLADLLATQTAAGAHDLPGQHTGENEYGAGYYKLPPGQRAMERARRMGQKVLPQP